MLEGNHLKSLFKKAGTFEPPGFSVPLLVASLCESVDPLAKTTFFSPPNGMIGFVGLGPSMTLDPSSVTLRRGGDLLWNCVDPERVLFRGTGTGVARTALICAVAIYTSRPDQLLSCRACQEVCCWPAKTSGDMLQLLGPE